MDKKCKHTSDFIEVKKLRVLEKETMTVSCPDCGKVLKKEEYNIQDRKGINFTKLLTVEEVERLYGKFKII